MPATSETILSQTTHPGDSTVTTVVGEKYKGDGYYGRSDGFHTVQVNVTGVSGTAKIQGTLATDPVDTDWFDIDGVEYNSGSNSGTGAFVYNFTGNFVWLRAYVTYTDGTFNSILLNH
jgi:hypothetical protein